jgi:hypothetical protein
MAEFASMNATQRGTLASWKLYYFRNGRKLPNNPDALRRIAALPRTDWGMGMIEDMIAEFFVEDGDNLKRAEWEAIAEVK